ncbi:MAG: carbon-nitrogen hydrolase family protein [Candidatus Hodarchaeota archaeon]
MQLKRIRIGLASLRRPESPSHGVEKIIDTLKQAASRKVDIVCLPESYIPGLRGMDFEVPEPNQERQKSILEEICTASKRYGVAIIFPTEWETQLGLHNIAFVVSETGEVLGYQTKNQLPPSEEEYYVPDGKRTIFTVKGVRFGIAICHEAWRYPETVRWAAVRGAQVVFHPHFCGSDESGGGDWEPYYDKAQICRALENTVYFASINNALQYQLSATSLISPGGELIASVPYHKEQLLVEDLELSEDIGFFAKRFNPSYY